VIAEQSVAPFGWSITWSDKDKSIEDLAEGLKKFIATSSEPWEIYWCAGAGVTSTDRSAVEREVAVFEAFIVEISRLSRNQIGRGKLFLASSVGGAYAGNPIPPYTESSHVAALSPYGEAKLRMEESVRSHSSQMGLRSFIARITNLYGPGQDLSKGQGLISVIAKTYFTGVPASIFVPLDTIRDYVYVGDCAKVVVQGMRKLDSVAPGETVTKIVGSANPVSIGALIGEFSRLRRSRPLIVLGAGNSSGQAPDLRVKSEVWPELDALVSTTLPAGIAATFQSMSQTAMTAE
jgi:UDP-glucose 4-epimerase